MVFKLLQAKCTIPKEREENREKELMTSLEEHVECFLAKSKMD
jgi:hypothetical protein